jgi:phenylpropionate dioxygenase-like ring-hydroxylating dioxygenase large terminal subunit
MGARSLWPKNSWYCAGWSHELTDAPLGRKLLGQYIVLFRNREGTVAALDGRCPHRFAPLGRGAVIGDKLACPYHGLQFAGDGQCVFNPHGTGKIPQGLRVRVYPLLERNGVLWLWAGEPEYADPAMLPDDHFLVDPEFSARTGYLKVNSNYQLPIDNLLDLTHGIFLHSASLLGTGTKKSAAQLAEAASNTRHQVKMSGDVVHSIHHFPPGPASGLRRRLVPSEMLCTQSDMAWYPASNLILQSDAWAGAQVGAGPPALRLPSAHYITPESETTSHYFVAIARNVNINDAAEDGNMMDLVLKAFIEEDEPMIRGCQDLMGTTDLMALKPTILETDRAAILARRITSRMIRDETRE